MSMAAFSPEGGARRVMNIGRFLTHNSMRLPNRPALKSGDEVLTWATLNARVDALAWSFQARGIGKGERILLSSPNCFEMIEAILAAYKLGAVIVPVNYRLQPRDVAYIAENCNARAYICHAALRAQSGALRETGVDWRFETVIGEPTQGEVSFETMVRESLERGPFDEAAVCDGDAAWFVFTSGTTGRPKAAVLTHGQLGYVITNHIADLMPTLSYNDVSLVLAPLSHGAGLHFLVQLARGACSVLPTESKVVPSEAWRLIEKERVTNIFAVPTLVKLLVDDPGANEFNHDSLRQVIYAGAPMYREDQKDALRKIGKVLIQYYGLAEVSGNISVLPADEHFTEDDRMKVGSCGFPRTGMHIDVQDETGQSLGANKTGEICVTGLGVFAGYHNNDVANAKAFRNGWFRTGDLGYLDEDGYLYITGRATDMIISGGMNIYPREVEERFLEHADVGEVAVVGLPDSKWGETCTAVVVPTAGAKLNAEGLAIWASKNLAVHQRPKHYYFWDVLPKSDYGKVDKLKVKRMLCDYSEA